MAACLDYLKVVISRGKGEGQYRKENIQFMQCLICLLSVIYLPHCYYQTSDVTLFMW